MLRAWRNLSLRLRLTVLYIGLLTVLLVALGSFLYVDTQNFLISTTTLRLQAQARPVTARAFRGNGPRPTPEATPANGTSSTNSTENPPALSDIARFLAVAETSPDTTAAVYDKEGSLLADGRTLPEQPFSAQLDMPLFKRALAGQEDVSYTADVAGQHTLVLLVPVRRFGSDNVITGVLQLSTRLDLVDQVLERQRLLILVGVITTLILGTAGGLWLTGSALAPLQWMIVTSRKIAAGDLSQRVNLPQRRDEIGQLASSFDEMVARLDETFAGQRQFIADASHELRTPLTAIAGTLDVILLAPEGDPQLTHRMLNGMRRELARLTRLVNDLLILTRLDVHQGLHPQTVDLAQVAREVAEQIKPVAGERTIQVESTGDTHVQGDPDRLKQVLLNLVDNAIRFTDPTNGVIRVQIAPADKDLKVTVSDNGSGIPPDAQPHIFERFYRVDKARARASGGSGLGLAIVQAIVEGHGGAVSPVKSKPGEGARFEFSLPRVSPIVKLDKFDKV